MQQRPCQKASWGQWNRGTQWFVIALILCSSLGLHHQVVAETSVTFAFWGDPAEGAAYEQVIAGFAEDGPGDRVVAQYTPGRDDYQRRLATAFSGNTPPDVFLINYRHYGQYVVAGALEPVGPFLAKSTAIAEGDFYQLPLDAFRSPDGELMCVPQNVSSLVVYYNVDMFLEAGIPLPTSGWTLNNFVAAAQALTIDRDGDGHIDVHGLVTDSSIVRYAPFIWMHNGEIVDDNQEPTRLLLDTQEARKGIEWLTELGAGGHNVVPTEAEVLAEDNHSRFMNGRAAMLFDSRRIVPTLREVDGFVWDVAPLPEGPEAAGVLHSDAFCLSAAATDKEAAWRFIEYAVGPKGQEILARTGRTVPSLTSIAESASFLGGESQLGNASGTVNASSPSSSHVFLDTIPLLRNLPSFGTWAEIEDIFNAEFQKSYYGDFDIDEALGNVQTFSEDPLRRANTGEQSDVSKHHLWTWSNRGAAAQSVSVFQTISS